MRYQDLVDRLGPHQAILYAKDQETFKATPSRLPFPVWDMSGAVPNISQKYESFKAFLESPSKGWVQRNAQMFAFTCSWASAAMFPPKESFSTVMRFFDKLIDNIQLHFCIDHLLTDQSTEPFKNFKALVDKTRLEVTQNRFLPATNYTVTTLPIGPTDGVFELDKILLGSYPMGFYEIWANRSSYNALKTAGVILPTYQFAPHPQAWDVQLEQNSNKVNLAYVGGTSPLSFDKTTLNFKTVTPITTLKLAAARNKKREPDQNRVMGNQGAPFMASKVWQSDAPGSDIEWLHRSAFSYSGLGNYGPKSSQNVNNLVLGTEATNTVMLRTEKFVQRYCQKEKTTVTVKTQIQWHQPNTQIQDIHDPLKYCSWLAPWIKYNITATNGTKSIDKTIYFETQARVTPLRFDLELGRKVEAAYYGWEDLATEVEYDDSDNQGAGAPQLKL